jgi:signal peptidase II
LSSRPHPPSGHSLPPAGEGTIAPNSVASPVRLVGEGGAQRRVRGRLNAYLPSVILLLLGFGLDRIHKALQISPDCLAPGKSLCADFAFGFVPPAMQGWKGGEYLPVTSFFDYVLVWTPGISYGLLTAVPGWALGLLIAAALLGLCVWWYRADSALVRAGLALAIGGALSNALDRWLYGGVADFFHFHWQDYSFYIFNLADTAITVGVCLLLLDLVGVGRRHPG